MKQQLKNKIEELRGLGNEAIGTSETTLRGVINALIAKIRSMFDTKDATATAAEVLVGKTAYNADGKITGTIETYAGTTEADETNIHSGSQKPMTLYLKPSDDWKASNARFAAYFFDNSGAAGKWISGTYQTENDCYKFARPSASYVNVIFCRMNPANSTNDWNNKWNQTDDLVIPVNGFTVYAMPSGVWDYTTDVYWEPYSVETLYYTVHGGRGFTIRLNKKYCDKDIKVKTAQVNSRAILNTPIPILTEEQMDLLMMDPEYGIVGTIYQYCGQDTEKYENNALYLLRTIEEVEE